MMLIKESKIKIKIVKTYYFLGVISYFLGLIKSKGNFYKVTFPILDRM